MSEREQKLEAAWHKALDAWMKCSRHSTKEEADKAAVSMLVEALSTPPDIPPLPDELLAQNMTCMHGFLKGNCPSCDPSASLRGASEWNEAIEAARQAVLNEATRIEEEGEWDDYTAYINVICALKRKEQP